MSSQTQSKNVNRSSSGSNHASSTSIDVAKNANRFKKPGGPISSFPHHPAAAGLKHQPIKVRHPSSYKPFVVRTPGHCTAYEVFNGPRSGFNPHPIVQNLFNSKKTFNPIRHPLSHERHNNKSIKVTKVFSKIWQVAYK